uniref:Uncharacterized protein n=1 Tax=Anguilla anguilla TaxID=7936 RepID=A0A0E9Q036_ANGAN
MNAGLNIHDFCSVAWLCSGSQGSGN